MTFVLLHGLGADRRQPLDLFGSVIAVAGVGAHARDPVVIAPDVRAHGESTVLGSSADFELDRLADEVVEDVARSLRSGEASARRPVTLIGISMGAALALRICLRGLLPVERAVFVRPSFDDHSLPANLRPFPVIGQLLFDVGARDGEARFRQTGLYLEMTRRSRAGAAGLLSQFTTADATRRAIRLIEIPRNRAFTSESELAQLAARGIRSLVVGAPRDPVHPLELAERWSGALAAPLAVVPARDDGQAAQTAAMRDAVARWLRER